MARLQISEKGVFDHERRRFFRSIYENIGDPISIIDVTVTGDFVYAGINPSCE